MSAHAKETIVEALKYHQGMEAYLNLIGEDLSQLCLDGLDLSYVLFRDCNLRGTVFGECIFYEADFAGALVDDMTGFYGCAIDTSTELSLNRVVNARPSFDRVSSTDIFSSVTFSLPLKIDGEFPGYKVAKTADGTFVLVTLRIPADAKHVVFAGRKCRASKAEVIAITNMFGTPFPDDTVAYSWLAAFGNVSYTKGATVVADYFDPLPSAECTHGIHFFLTREEAIGYANRMKP